MPLVHIKTNRLEYKFNIVGKYTVIKGDSGTGKTTFYDLVTAMNQSPASVQNLCDAKVIAVPAIFDDFKIENYNNCIFVLDEDCTLFRKSNVASFFRKSNNYFIIINRSLKINYLPIHVDNVFKIKTSGKFHTLEHLNKRHNLLHMHTPEIILTEDSKSGFLFLKDFIASYLKNKTIKIVAASLNTNDAGASKISKNLIHLIESGYKEILIVYDAAAFAPFIDILEEIIRSHNKISINVLDWDSFENYILNSPMFNCKLSQEDANCSYESYEQFALTVIQKIIPKYSKSKLAECLKFNRCINGCLNIANCNFKHKKYSDLIYAELENFEKTIKSELEEHLDYDENSIKPLDTFN